MNGGTMSKTKKLNDVTPEEWDKAHGVNKPDAHYRFVDPYDIAPESTSNGLTAKYYELPEGATELHHIISYKNMNANLGEIMRSCYRYGEASHSDKLRDIRKIIAYAKFEEERLLKYENIK